MCGSGPRGAACNKRLKAVLSVPRQAKERNSNRFKQGLTQTKTKSLPLLQRSSIAEAPHVYSSNYCSGRDTRWSVLLERAHKLKFVQRAPEQPHTAASSLQGFSAGEDGGTALESYTLEKLSNNVRAWFLKTRRPPAPVNYAPEGSFRAQTAAAEAAQLAPRAAAPMN